MITKKDVLAGTEQIYDKFHEDLVDYCSKTLQPEIKRVCDTYNVSFDVGMGSADFNFVDKSMKRFLNDEDLSWVCNDNDYELSDLAERRAEWIDDDPDEYDYTKEEIMELDDLFTEVGNLAGILNSHYDDSKYSLIGDFCSDYSPR